MRLRQHRVSGQWPAFVLFGLLASGCIPSFKGFQPVTQKDLQPLGSKQTMPDAEILWMEAEYYHRWGQVGQSQRTTLWRMNKRIRINKHGGLKYASFKYLPGGFGVWSPFNRLQKFNVRATCPNNKVLQYDDRVLKELRVKFYSRGTDAVETVQENQVFHAHLPGIEVGCVLDVMWEYDLSMQFDRFFFGLTGVRIDLLQEIPVRRAHMRYHYAENLEMRIDLDPLFVLQTLQTREATQRIASVMAEINLLLEQFPAEKKAAAQAWLKGLDLKQKTLMVNVFDRLPEDKRIAALNVFPMMSATERQAVIQRLQVSAPESAEKVKGTIDPNKPLETPKAPVSDKLQLDLAVEQAIRAALVADEADRSFGGDAVRVSHDRDSRMIDVYMRNIPGMTRQGRMGLDAMCKTAALPPRYCKPPQATIKIVRMLDTRLAEYQDIRAEWKNVIAWYTRAMWPFQDDRGGFNRNFQMDEDQELNQNGLPKIARDLTRNATSREEKIKVIYEHLRQNLYVQGAIGLAPINFGLSSGEDLLRSYQMRTGNPYVSNMLFIVMLRSLGIRAYAALVPNGYYDYRKGLPDRDVFGGLSVFIPEESEGPWRGLHAERAADAAKFPLPGKERTVNQGRLLSPAGIVDPYNATNPRAEGVEAFIIDYGGGRFFKTPSQPYTYTQNHRTFDMQVDEEGTLTGSYEIKLTGHLAADVRRQLLFAQPRDWETWRKQRGGWLRQVCGQQFEITDLVLPELNIQDLSQPVTYRYKFKAHHCFPHSQKVMLYKTPGTLPSYSFTAPNRDVKLFFEYPYIKDTKITLRFPPSFKLGLNLRKSAKAEEHSYDKSFDGVVYLKTSHKIEGNVFGQHTHIEFRQRELPAERYQAFRAFWQKTAKAITFQIAHK